MKNCFLFILAAFSSLTLVAQLEKLDGSVSEEEQEKLQLIGKNESNQMLIDQSSAEYVKITIKSVKLYVASLCACTAKGEVIVMHASAALGDQLYTRDDAGWSTKDTFNWEVRETTMTDEIIEKRRKFLETHGWVANTVAMGNDGESEFIISRKLLGDKDVYLAIGLMTQSDPENILGIPATGAGDCAAFTLVSGNTAPTYSFDPSKWIKIQ